MNQISPRRSHKSPRTPGAARSTARRQNNKRKEPAGENYYTIRDIVKEDVRQGRLWYLIDWDDDPDTGEKFPHSWEPAEHVTDAAVLDWEHRKQTSTNPATTSEASASESQPVQAPNWRARLQGSSIGGGRGADRPAKKQRLAHSVGVASEAEDIGVSGEDSRDSTAQWPPPNGQTLIVEIRKLPGFDPSEYLKVHSSQSSVPSSTNEPASSHSISSHDQSLQEHRIISQRTIPDSQEFTDSLPSRLADYLPDYEGPILADAGRGSRPSSPARHSQEASAQNQPTLHHLRLTTQSTSSSSKRSSGTLSQDIPSRQPDSFQDRSQYSTTPDSRKSSVPRRDTIPDSGPISRLQTRENLTQRSSQSDPFLTQPQASSEFLVLESSLSAGAGEIASFESLQDASLTEAHHSQEAGQDSAPTFGAGEASESQASPHSAQVVPTLAGSRDELLTQDFRDFSVYSEEEGSTVPETVQKQGRELETSQASSQALSESDGNAQKSIPDTPSCVIETPSTRPRSKQTLEALNSNKDCESRAETELQERVQGHSPRVKRTILPRSATTEEKPSEDLRQGEALYSTAPSAPLARMEETPRLSAIEQLREMKKGFMSRTSTELPSLSATTEVSRGQEDGLVTSILSPSTVLPLADGASLATLPVEGPETQQQQHSQLDEQAFVVDSLAPPLAIPETIDNGLGLQVGSTVEQLINPEAAPTTIAPADLAISTDSVLGAIDTLSEINPSILDSRVAEEGLVDSLGDDVLLPILESTASLPNADIQQSLPAFEPSLDDGERDFVVTLPLAANTRLFYIETLKENKHDLAAFNAAFVSEDTKDEDGNVVVDDRVVAHIDAMFQHLFDLCDLPAFESDIPELPTESMMRHATGTNGKLSFVYEFLENLGDTSKKVLLLSRPGRVQDWLEAVVKTADVPYLRLGEAGLDVAEAEGLSVTLATSDQVRDLSQVTTNFDVVIAYDNTTRSDSPLSNTFPGNPIVLSLVATCSIEHIALQIPPQMTPIEKKNAMIFAMVTSRELISYPERGYLEPHEVASLFAEHVKDPDEAFAWEPQPVPNELLDFFVSSQSQEALQLENPSIGIQLQDSQESVAGRKRPLDDDHDIESGTPKRTRLVDPIVALASKPPKMTDLLKHTLAAHEISGTSSSETAAVPVVQLEAMAAKIAELETQLSDKDAIEQRLGQSVRNLETSLKSHERFVKKLQPKYMEALKDRGVFEATKIKADEEVKAATKRLESSKAEVESLKEQKVLLEAKLAEVIDTMAKDSDPERAAFAQGKKDVEEARATAAALEKKLASAQQDLNYARDAYQKASNSFTELNAENGALKEQIRELEKRAGDNVVAIHKINAEAQSQEYRNLYEGLQAMLRDRERELDRAREELRLLKNGRRETRQASVPRSPRMGVMSPRGGAARGANAGSRGTSPTFESAAGHVAGMNFFQPPGNGRFSHLRD